MQLINSYHCRPQNPPRLVLPVRYEGFQQGDETDSGGISVRPEEVPAAGRDQLQPCLAWQSLGWAD